jgi:hypothetical protein
MQKLVTKWQHSELYSHKVVNDIILSITRKLEAFVFLCNCNDTMKHLILAIACCKVQQ